MTDFHEKDSLIEERTLSLSGSNVVFPSQKISFFLIVLLICSGIPETPRFPPLSYYFM
jgi:hypothetical protein